MKKTIGKACWTVLLVISKPWMVGTQEIRHMAISLVGWSDYPFMTKSTWEPKTSWLVSINIFTIDILQIMNSIKRPAWLIDNGAYFMEQMEILKLTFLRSSYNAESSNKVSS